MVKNTNAYSQEETSKLIELYQEYGTDRLDDIAILMNKSVKSVRSKLVREKIYIPTKTSYIKKTGRSKKELLRELEDIVSIDVSGFMGASKESLISLINFLKKKDEK